MKPAEDVMMNKRKKLYWHYMFNCNSNEYTWYLCSKKHLTTLAMYDLFVVEDYVVPEHNKLFRLCAGYHSETF